MSKMPDAFAAHEAQYKNVLDHQTWGHLFPKGKYFEGNLTLCETLYGQAEVIKEDIDILNSPWWYDAAQKFAYDFMEEHSKEGGSIFKVWVAVSVVMTYKEGWEEDGKGGFLMEEDGETFEFKVLKFREIS